MALLNSSRFSRIIASSVCFKSSAPVSRGSGSFLSGTARPSLHTKGRTMFSTMTVRSAKVALEPPSMLSISVSQADHSNWEGDLLAIAVHDSHFKTEADVTSIASEEVKALDASLGGSISDLLEAGGFEGKAGTVSKVSRVLGSGFKAKYVVLAGLGAADKASPVADWGASIYQKAGAGLAGAAKAQRVKSMAVAFLAPVSEDTAAGIISKLGAGLLLGGYESTRFKSKVTGGSKLQAVQLLLSAAEDVAAEAVTKAIAVAKGTILTKYLVEAPPNVCTPTHMAEAAQHLAAQHPDVFKLTVLEKEECAALGMGSYLGVAEASEEPPKFIHLAYTPKGGSKRKVAVVGKGLTFDSGGYNLKAGPGSMIEMMKFDMGGAAATLGAAAIVGQLQPADVEVHFIIASCENMVSGKGLRPGDILTAASGKTIEVNNTDAEGRLTLADALWYAQEKAGATAIVDVATLTGACIIALGGEIAGLFTPSDKMAAALAGASKSAGEKLWRMPMEDAYFEQLKSPVADMKNTGTRAGGSITAALFLKQFVKEGVEWAHLDMAGPVWDDKQGLPSGYGAALLAEWAANHSEL